MITIIPAIDIIDGQCVRLTQGDYAQKTIYYKDPLEIALQFEDLGLSRLHLVDLDGAKAAWPTNLATLERLATNTKLEIQYGGGIKDRQAIKAVFDHGATRAICGSIAVQKPAEFASWLDEFTPERVILGADVRNSMVAINGWLEAATITVEALIEKFPTLQQVICTEISRDGMLQGPDFDLYDRLQKQFPAVEITVSGGISSWNDILELDKMKLRSVIIGKAIYEGHIKMEQLCLQNE